MTIPIYQVDAFSDAPFAGNPAAVCLLETEADAEWMQQVAAEMNLSETAFLVPSSNGFDLRWFTPASEVRLCGHATLASAHVLWNEVGCEKNRRLRFSTRSGVLTASLIDRRIELDFPSRPGRAVPPPEGLEAALGTKALQVKRSTDDVLVLLDDETAVRAVEPDFEALRATDARGVIVTAAATDENTDFVSRFFGPAVGINEDPVTGSAHCCLAPFWKNRLGKKLMTGYQASPRGGFVEVEVVGDRVKLRGNAVTVFRGQLLAEP